MWSANKRMCGYLNLISSLVCWYLSPLPTKWQIITTTPTITVLVPQRLLEKPILFTSQSNFVFFFSSVQFDIFWDFTFFRHINTELLQCLNESEHGSIKKIFKPWDKRLDKTTVKSSNLLKVNCWCFQAIYWQFFLQFVESAVDEELIIFIPYVNFRWIYRTHEL